MAKKKNNLPTFAEYTKQNPTYGNNNLQTFEDYQNGRKTGVTSRPLSGISTVESYLAAKKRARRQYATIKAGQELFGSMYELKTKSPEFMDSMLRGAEAISKQPLTKSQRMSAYLGSLNKQPEAMKNIQQLPKDSAVLRSRDEMKQAQKENIEKQKALYKQKQQLKNVMTGDVPHSTWLGSMPEETRQILTAGKSHEIIKEMEKLKEQGQWNSEDDINMWTKEHRATMRELWKGEEKKYQKQIEELDNQIKAGTGGNRWDALLDLYTTPEVENERTILAGAGYSEEDKRRAQEKLNILLNKNAGIGTQTPTERAQNFIRYNANNMSTLRDQMNMDSMRRMIYDNMNGEGAYDTAVANMNKKQRREFDERLNNALDYVADPNGKLGIEKRTAEMQMQILQDKMNEADAADRREEEYHKFMAGRDYADTEYHEENNIYNRILKDSENDEYTEGPSFVIRPADEIYAVLGGDNYDINRDITLTGYGKAALMDDEPGPDGYSERDIFLSYYNAQLYDEAEAFYKGLEPTLNQRYHYFEKIKLEDQASRIPVLSSVASVAATPLQTVEFLLNLPGQVKAMITGEDNAQTDPYSSAYAITRYKNITRNKIAQNLGDIGWFYQGLMSGADSAVNVAIGKGLGLTGNALQYGTLALFGTQAFETSLQNNMERGSNNFTYDWMEAFLDAAIETATEVWSVENWLADPTNIMTYVGKIAISEPSEEIAGAIIEPYIKEMLGHKNEWKERAKQILGAGGYQDASGEWVKVTDADAATRQAMREWNHEIRMAAQTALVSIGPAAVYGGGQIAYRTAQEGQNVKSKPGGLQNIVEAGMGLDSDTKSYKEAQKIQDKNNNGKKVSDYEAGKLATDVLREGTERGNTKAHDITERFVRDQLKKAGVEDDELTRIITKALEGKGTESLTKEERRTLNANHAALNTYAQMRHAGQTREQLKEKRKEAAESESQAVNSVADVLTYGKMARNRGKGDGVHLATEADLRNASGNAVLGGRGVIVDGNHARLDGIKITKNENGELKATYEVTVNGEKKTVEAGSMLATDLRTAQIIQMARDNPQFYSEGYANKLLELQEQGKLKGNDALNDARLIRLHAYAGIKMPITRLDTQLANELYMQSQKEHADNRLAQVGENRNEAGKGKATYNGAEYGTEAWTKAVENLDDNIKAEMDAIANIAKTAGIEVDFAELDDAKTYGWQKGKTVGVNINGLNFGFINGKIQATGRHNIMVTFGHEMTHWLQANSLKGYNRLEQYIMQQFVKNSNTQELIRRLDHYMLDYGYTLEEAMSEVVANGCDQILNNEEVAKHIEETDKSLYKEIQGFVKNLVEKVKKAINKSSMQDSASYEARIIARGANELLKLWLGAYDEALSNATRQAEAQPAEKETSSALEAVDRWAEGMDGNTRYSKADAQEFTKPFAEQLDDFVNPEINNAEVFKRDSLVVSGAPKVFTDIGLPKLPVTINQEHIGYALNGNYPKAQYVEGHMFSVDELKKLPEKIAHPIAIAYDPSSTKSVIAYVDMKNTTGDQVIIPIKIGGITNIGNERTNTLKLSTVFAKQDGKAMLESAIKNNSAEKATLFYINKKRAIGSGLRDDIITIVRGLDSGLIHSINDAASSVKPDVQNVTDSKQFKRWFGNSKIVNEDGTPKIMYHGTLKGGFDVFGGRNDFWYFADSKDYAKVFAGRNNNNTWAKGIRDSIISGKLKPQIYEVYLSVQNPFVTDDEDIVESALYWDHSLAQELRDKGYDALMLSDMSQVIVLNPNQIKSATDNIGTYSKKTDNIRFSMAEAVEERADGLVAVHNLTENNLLDTLSEGGFTAPSIAVVKAQTGHSKFGEISVIFTKDTIDPKRDRGNKIYGADAWTPTRSNAQIETKLDYDKMQEAKKEVKQIMENADPYYAHEAERWIGEKAYQDDTNKTLDEWADQAAFNEGMLAAFMTAEGQEIKKEYKQIKDNQELSDDEKHINMYNGFLDDMERLGYLDQFMETMEKESINFNMEQWGRLLAASTEDKTINKVVENYFSDDPGLSKRILSSWLRQIYLYERDGRQIKYHDEIDRYKMRETMQNTVNRPRFNKWITNLFSRAFGERGVYKGKDPYFNDGSRRSWKSLHWAPTAENIVKAMYTNHEAKGGEAGGATGLIAKASKEYKNIDQVREDSGRLQMLDEKEYEEKIKQLDEELNEFISDVADTTGKDYYSIKESMIDAAGQYAKSEKIDWFNYALNDYGIKLEPDQTEKAMELLEKARNIETGYFEAKPERVVGLDEVAKVILPADTSAELTDKLDDAGIQYVTYDGTDEDRLKKLNEIEGVRFSKADDMTGLDAGVWLATVSPWSGLQTEDERIMQEAYKAKRLSISLSLHKQMEYKAKLNALEHKEHFTDEDKTAALKLYSKLGEEKRKLARLEEEMHQIQSQEGYAGMMYRNSKVFGDLVQGKTSEQVQETVNAMLEEVKAANEEIKQRAEELKELEQTQAVKAMKSFLGKTSLSQQAAILRKQYNSTLNKQEIEDRLAAMALKLATGQDIQSDAEGLATDLVDKIRGERTDNLEYIRGVTLTIGDDMLRELKAENTSIKELRNRIMGSGVKLITGEKSHFIEQWDELRKNNKELVDAHRADNARNALEAIIESIEDELEASTGKQQFKINLDELTAVCYASAASVTTYLVKDPAAKKQITELMGQIKELRNQTGGIAERLEQLSSKMESVVSAGYKAADWAGILSSDMRGAIDYYNKVAALAAKEERTKVRKDLIEQLRSESAKKLYQVQDEYRQMMLEDRKARLVAKDNEVLRRKVDNRVKYLQTRLLAETDKKNIPEETKALARELLNKLITHDLSGVRRVLFEDTERLRDAKERLKRLTGEEKFDAERDLGWLVIDTGTGEKDYSIRDQIADDLRQIDNAILMYWTAEGNKLNSLEDRKKALLDLQKAVDEIYGAIKARGEAFIKGKRYEIAQLGAQAEQEMEKSKYKGERYGRGSKAKDAIENAIGYGNLTPEYFFKNLKNKVFSLLFDGMKSAENRNGLLAQKAQADIAKIAQETGFSTWDGQKKQSVKVNNVLSVDMTTEQIMALYATWQREKNQMRPELTAHLLRGGFVLGTEDRSKGKHGRARNDQRPIRMTKENLDSLDKYLTKEQKEFVDRVVKYLSEDMAELGNEASLETYGVKKFTEKYYFPIKSWSGVLAQESNRGVNNNNDNAAMRQSFSKRTTAGAQNAIEIGDFTATAMKHIVGMITFNTIGPAVENMNKVLNYKLKYGDIVYNEAGEVVEDDQYERNVRAVFESAYGKNAANYMKQFMKDINGGTAQGQGNTVWDKLLSTFKKNAVAGSLSVAAQQPLSYIRAAMMINPKYLAQALATGYKGAYEELLKYSGVAVLKHMGKFDMNYGRSMIDYITPDALKSKGKAVVEFISDKSTALPALLDDLTWARMWVAVKAEQKALHPGMDVKSEAFLQMAAERFNDLMRRTQVYDSVMVKSQNMRNNHPFAKTITSFMAEPTLSLHVLADAWQNIKTPGGKANAAKALATFLLSAAAQAGAKALFSAGRSPDKKKNREENYLYRLNYNLINELNPLNLIPGYSNIVDLLKNGELTDNSMSVLAKAKDALVGIKDLFISNDKNWYRKFEDTIGQLVQIGTDVPMKNFLRDFRAMVNLFSNGTAGSFTGGAYAQRETSGAVLKYQTLDLLHTEDLIGLINKELGEAGWKTGRTDYVQRLYDAEKKGDKKKAADLMDYLKNIKVNQPAKGTKEEAINNDLKGLIKKDESLSYKDRIKSLRNKGMKDSDIASWIATEYKEGRIKKAEAVKLYREANPAKTENDAYFFFEQIDYEDKNKVDLNTSDYFRLNEALSKNDQKAVESATKELLEHGKSQDDVKDRKKAYVVNQYKDSKLTRKQAEEQLKKWRPDLSDDDIYWTFDLIDYKNETGNKDASGKSYRLIDAMTANKSDAIRTAIKAMTEHGVKKESIKSSITSYWKEKYLAAKAASKERNAIRDAIQKAYKAMGLTTADANKVIEGWTKPKKTKKKTTK